MKLSAREKSNLRMLLIAALLLLIVLNASTAWGLLGTLWGIVFPLALGAVMAFILNIPMKALERVLFPRSERPRVVRFRRPLCFALSLVGITLVLALVVVLVVPQLLTAVAIIVSESLQVLDGLRQWAAGHSEELAQLFAMLPEEESVDESQLSEQIVQIAGQGALGLFSIVSRTASGVANFVFGLILAMYLLMDKEKLTRQARLVGRRYLSANLVARIDHALCIAHAKFEQFIVGQCVEAFILGVLCMIGMLILQLPYAPTIGALIAATSLIPLIGSYLGGVLGAFIILSVDPMQALIFLVFLIILQQVESNVIYSHTVGNALQLPGIWVTAAVTVGAGIAGIPGMLVGVPFAATVYDLLREDVYRGLPPEDVETAETDHADEKPAMPSPTTPGTSARIP